MTAKSIPAVPEKLRDFFAAHGRLALAFSGGTDSAYLMYAASACGADVRAYYVHAQFQPAFERRDAERLAAELSVPMTVLERDVLSLSAEGKQLLVMTAGSLALYDQGLVRQYANETLMTAKRAILRPAGDILLLHAYSAERFRF